MENCNIFIKMLSLHPMKKKVSSHQFFISGVADDQDIFYLAKSFGLRFFL